MHLAWLQALGTSICPLNACLSAQDLVTFKATGADGSPIYHTNVMMAIGSTYAIVCAESVGDETERQHLLARLQQTHKVSLTYTLMFKGARALAMATSIAQDCRAQGLPAS